MKTPTEQQKLDAEDAARFRWLQDNPIRAQALFWNYLSRRQRAEAIDMAMKLMEENPSLL